MGGDACGGVRPLADRAAGYRAIVLTVDTWSLGWRPRDLALAHQPFLHGEGIANYCGPTCRCWSRGVFAVLTSQGLEVLRSAAPTHVRGVRHNLVDLLSEEERLVLAGVVERVVRHLREQ